MSDNTYSIEFMFKGVEYFGSVQPFIASHRTVYKVSLEADNGGESLKLLLKPSQSDLDQWESEYADELSGRDTDGELLPVVCEEVAAVLANLKKKAARY